MPQVKRHIRTMNHVMPSAGKTSGHHVVKFNIAGLSDEQVRTLKMTIDRVGGGVIGFGGGVLMATVPAAMLVALTGVAPILAVGVGAGVMGTTLGLVSVAGGLKASDYAKQGPKYLDSLYKDTIVRQNPELRKQ